MDLSGIARQIQYQAAKLEVLGEILQHSNKYDPHPGVDVLYTTVFAFQEDLFNESEACINGFLEDEALMTTSLQSTLVDTTSFLLQLNNGTVSTEPPVIFFERINRGYNH